MDNVGQIQNDVYKSEDLDGSISRLRGEKCTGGVTGG